MNALRSLIAGLFDALFGWAQSQAEKPKPIEDAATPPAKLEAYQDRIELWKKEKSARDAAERAGKASAVALAALLLAGCATRSTILINSDSDMVIIRKPVKAEIGVWRDGHWVEAGKGTLPAGWVAGPERK